MDVRHLQHFARLALELHFGRTADALDISQSTLSSQIAALERAFGTELFERTQRRVRLTAAGAILLQHIEPLLAQLDDIERKVREAGAGERGTLTIGASEPVINRFLPAAIERFRARFPHVKLRVRAKLTEDALDDLLNFRIDVALARPSRAIDTIAARTLGNVPYQAIVPAAHPLAAAPVVALSELSGHTLFTYPRRIIGAEYDALIATCSGLGFVPSAIEEVDDTATIIALVACGLGVSILPEGTALEGRRVASRPIAGCTWVYEVAAMWRAADAGRPVQEFIQLFD